MLGFVFGAKFMGAFLKILEPSSLKLVLRRAAPLACDMTGCSSMSPDANEPSDRFKGRAKGSKSGDCRGLFC